MESKKCNACGTATYEKASYCHNCGSILNCKSCGETLMKNANNCISCGASVLRSEASLGEAVNTVKYHRTKDEIFCDVALTNEVGKEGIVELISGLTNNRNDSSRQLATLNGHSDFQNQMQQEDTVEGEVEEIEKMDSSRNVYENGPKIQPQNTAEFPHINDVEMNVNCNEAEWILIYAFYESDFAMKTFSRADVYKRYMEKRKTASRVKNFSSYWKVLFKHYISTVNETTFKFKPDKLDHIKALILGKQKGNVRSFAKNATGKKSKERDDIKLTKAKTGNKKAPGKTIEVEEFDAFKGPKKISLEDFFSEKKPGTTASNRIALIGYYITKINKQPVFTEGQIDYAYKALRLTGRPNHLTQIINNLKNERAWFKRGNENGKEGWKLERPCELFVEDKLPLNGK